MKAYDLPITHNPLKSRDDVAQSLLQMLEPCEDKLVEGGSGLFVGNSSAVFSSKVALFEGWSRLLWGIGPLVAGGYDWQGLDLHSQGFVEGPDPKSPYYWGDVGPVDQRMVEMAAMALSLLVAPSHYWVPLSTHERKNLSTWLYTINEETVCDNNWLFFRVLVNLALESLGENHAPELMEHDLSILEDFYVGDGWYRDKVPFDGYNPFAFHFYSMVYYRYKSELDGERCARFKERAGLFAQQFVHYFTDEGQCVPFGRSQTYRFAMASFFSACSFAGLKVLPWGVMKGIILRNLRWWFSQPIFDREGMLSIGFAYPTLLIAEQYNSPGSPYWSFKIFLILALGEEHPFWTSIEQSMPKLPKVTLLTVPRTLMCRSSHDVVMLNAGQYPLYQMNHAAEKYAKFAYSAMYGFSASLSGYDFEKTGCDSMLYVSEGDNYWRPRRESYDYELSDSVVRSRWKPYGDVTVTTWLLPCGDWHIRVHKIESERTLTSKEGGFGMLNYRGFELEPTIEYLQDTKQSLAVRLPWGTTAIIDLLQNREASWIKPMPNLNFTQDTTIVPYLEGTIGKGTTYFACMVGASCEPDFFRTRPAPTVDRENMVVKVGGKRIALL